MAEDMSSSWRYINSAKSRIFSLKGYLGSQESTSSWRSSRDNVNVIEGHPHPETPQSWRAWAGQKIRVRKSGMYPSGSSNSEMVNVFPGWATRRYPAGPSTSALGGLRPFQLEIFVSGYAISYRPPENASRAQRAFMRLAKGYAYLPKLVEIVGDVQTNTSSLAQLTPSTEELLAKVALPPRPTEITDDYDAEDLDRQLRLAKAGTDDEHSNTSSPSSSTEDLPATGGSAQTTIPPPGISISNAAMSIDVIRQLHANLERRLQPFWSSVLPNRTVRLLVFASPHHDQAEPPRANSKESIDEEISPDIEHGLLAYQDVTTSADGSFQVKFKVNWEEICHHPKALHIAFGESIKEHDLLVVARLLPLAGDPQHPLEANSLPQETTPLASLTRIPITHSPIRVISDVDDTIKLSGIPLGTRAVFHNVFVKDLKDNIIPGMGEWYTRLWDKGVRFHYVSNGPFEYLPVLNEFFELSKIPAGSIKLRSYAGRSLFSGLLSAPATRKRAGVVDILDSFPDSRFFLIGDTGEQDLELYADLARERPDRILAVFVRDADSSTEPLDDPTGWSAIDDAGTRVKGPLIPRSDSGASSTSLSTLSSSKYNYGAATRLPLNPANLDSNNTMRSSTNQRREPVTSYFNSELTREPEDNLATPTPLSYARMESSDIQQSHSSHGRHRILPSIASHVSAKLFTDRPPKPIDPPSIQGSFNATRSSASARSQQSTSSTSSTESNGKRPVLSGAERKRNELQMRVYRARTQMPGNVYLRVFRDPKECVEAQQILDLEV